jgi:hypothetical protein
MKENDICTLKAFLIALTQLDAPLPKQQQTRLQEIAENVVANLGKLDAIIESYPPLNKLYLEASKPFQDNARERTKAGFPKIDHAAEQQSTETSNAIVANIEDMDKQQSIQNMDEQQLINTANKVFASENPVAAITALLIAGCPAI